MVENGKLFIAKNENPVFLYPKMANRHGLIAGATGTGKTVTLKVMAESFSDIGVPVFVSDIKGDVSGMCKPGVMNDGLQKRLDKMGITGLTFQSYPTCFWDVFGEKGIPVRATISSMGPVLLSRLLGLSDAQTGVLNIVFRIADDKKLLLIDLKDLRAMLQYIGENAKEFTTEYGAVSTQSVGVIQRALFSLEDSGGSVFFGEPELSVTDWMRCDTDGRGFVNVLDCVKLFQSPILYSTFLLWMLSDLFEILPEVGDCEKPKMVFFFDEAHLLFKDTPRALVDKIEQVVKLIRSKGVGVYFITQSPSDLPDAVLAQLGNRVQHALRAYTPAEQKNIRTAAQAFRVNPAFKTEDVITELGTGEALVSCLDEEGRPSVVERAKIVAPGSLMGPADDERRHAVMVASEFYAKYKETIDRESAYEDLKQVQDEQAAVEQKQAEQEAADKQAALDEKERLKAEKVKEKAEKEKEREIERREKEIEREARARASSRKPAGRTRKTALEKTVDTTMNTIGREVGRSIARGLMGILKR